MILIKRGQAPGSFPDTILSVITHLSTRVIPVQDILHNIIYIYTYNALNLSVCLSVRYRIAHRWSYRKTKYTMTLR